MDKKASDNIEEETTRILAEFSKYLLETNTDDFLVIVLRGHLYVEHELTELIKLFLENKEYFKINNFKAKLDLARALGAIEIDWYPSLVKLNNLRNKYAHNLFYTLTENDYNEFISSLSKDVSGFYFKIYEGLRNAFGETIQTRMRVLIGSLWFYMRIQQNSSDLIKGIQYLKFEKSRKQFENLKILSEIAELESEKANLEKEILTQKMETEEIETELAKTQSIIKELKMEAAKLEIIRQSD